MCAMTSQNVLRMPSGRHSPITDLLRYHVLVRVYDGDADRWIEDLKEARRFIAERTHGSWLKTAVAARFAVLKNIAHGEERAMV